MILHLKKNLEKLLNLYRRTKAEEAEQVVVPQPPQREPVVDSEEGDLGNLNNDNGNDNDDDNGNGNGNNENNNDDDNGNGMIMVMIMIMIMVMKKNQSQLIVKNLI